jgi:uncharacterized protein (DUF488 family)
LVEDLQNNSEMNCTVPRTVHTIGHSTRGIEGFTALLKTHAVTLVVDVRRWPASRRYPHFRREALMESLRAESIDYLWRGDLGGFRKPSADSQNTAWKIGAFRAYADFMLTPEFETIMQEMAQLAASKRITIMCAEAVPWRCHRQLLADAFLVRGFFVRHIIDDGCHEHHLPPFAMPKGKEIFYLASPQLEFAKQR